MSNSSSNYLPDDWFKVANAAPEQTAKVGCTAMLVYIALCRYADEHGQCYPSAQHIGQILGLHKGTVVRALGRLETAGLIVVKRRNGELNSYALPPIGTGSAGAPVALAHQTGSAGATAPVALAHQTGSAGATQKKTKEKDTRRKTAAESVAIPPELDSGRFQEAWSEWHTYRKASRKALTPQTASKQLKELAGWGEATAVEAIEISIKQGWAGLFPPKESRNGRKPIEVGPGQRFREPGYGDEGNF